MNNIREIGSRSFSFEDYHGAEVLFNIGNHSYKLLPVEKGYSISTKNEQFTVQYNKGKAKFSIADGRKNLNVDYDFSNLPNVKVIVKSKDNIILNIEDTTINAAQKLLFSHHDRQEYPNPNGLKVLFHQINGCSDFWPRLSRYITVLIPYDDYYPYFEPTNSCTIYKSSCLIWCWVCSLAVAGTPGIPFDDLIACGICLVCKIGSGGYVN
ncbi:hypothetical protein [Brevibacillus laterosporus]|uniref:hypothetical protein n=1 Tax=Brevibacillus laterosporus TaxID=1465 RepID=UPI001EF3080B|nr:hypothetical protein [Brevibacillus laterosporus]MCG7320232.1 hypothetical protein [Brevibacillus laterosporus]